MTRTLEETRTMQMIKKMHEARNSGEKIQQAYSEEILASGDPKLNFFAAQELKINFDKHLEKVLEANVLHWNHMGLELCLELKNLDAETKYNFVTKFYEKILGNENNTGVLYKTTELMEKEGMFTEYLTGKPNSEHYKAICLENQKRVLEELRELNRTHRL